MSTEKNKKGDAFIMTIYKVIGILPIDGNTAVTIDGRGDLFKNGIGILDENGKPYEVLSVGMTAGSNVEEMLNKTSLLIKGDFSSAQMYV